MKLKKIIQIVCFGGISILSAQSIPSNVPKNGIQSWYSFSGNANDESGNGNNGKAVATSLTADRFGNPNSAYYFNGTSSYVDVNAALGNFKQSDFSFSCWVFDTSTLNLSVRTLIGKRNAIGYGNFLNLTWKNSPCIEIDQASSSSSDYFTNCSNQAYMGKWYHYVFVRSGLKLLTYINGILIRTDNTAIIHNINNNANFTIGARYSSSSVTQYFKGKIDDVGVWNRALTISEIQSLGSANLNSNCELIKKVCASVNPKISSGLMAEPAMSYLNTNPKLQRRKSKIDLPINIWTHIALVKKDTTIYIYKNGLFVDSTSYYKGFTYSWNKLIIGASYFTNYINMFKGSIDDIRYSNQIRTSTEILTNYNSGNAAVSDAKTNGLWNLDTLNILSGKFGATKGTSGSSSGIKIVSGKYGKAFQFNGLTSHGDILTSISNVNHSIEFWIKPDTMAASWPIAFYGTNSAGFMLQPLSSFTTYKWSTGDTGLTSCFDPSQNQFITVTDGNCIDTLYTAWNKTTITKNDTNHVTINDTFKISVTDTLYVNVLFTGTNGISSNLVKVYPNPTSSNLIIDFNDYNNILGYNIQIYNVSGQTMYNNSVTQQIINIDLSTWKSKGVYFLKITDKSGKSTDIKKIILQ